MNVLSIDTGGTHVKILATGQRTPREFASGTTLTNTAVNHPVGATWMKNAAKRGTKLIVADPRRTELARNATYFLQFNADTDVALLNAMIHAIIEEGLVNENFVKDRTSGFDALKENAKNFSPEKMAPICGIPAQTIREVARLFATSRGSMILWGSPWRGRPEKYPPARYCETGRSCASRISSAPRVWRCWCGSRTTPR